MDTILATLVGDEWEQHRSEDDEIYYVNVATREETPSTPDGYEDRIEVSLGQPWRFYPRLLHSHSASTDSISGRLGRRRYRLPAPLVSIHLQPASQTHN